MVAADRRARSSPVNVRVHRPFLDAHLASPRVALAPRSGNNSSARSIGVADVLHSVEVIVSPFASGVRPFPNRWSP
jgi:hypothetical protein